MEKPRLPLIQWLPMKKFVTLLSLWEQNTAAMTRQLPTITSISMNPRIAKDIRFFGSVHWTDSINWSHSVSFILLTFYALIQLSN